MSEAAVQNSVAEGVFDVEEGDDVHLAAHDYEWTNPYEVTDVEHVDWVAATGGTWATRTVVVEGGYGSTFQVSAVEDETDLDLRKPSGTKRGDLERFEPLDHEDDKSGTSTEDDTTSGSNSESEAETDLEEDATDGGPADAGDDVQEEITSEEITVDGVDDDTFECDCGATFETRQALQGHGPKSCDGDGSDPVDLPEGVTASRIGELTSGGITIADLADELGVHRNRARTIAFKLGYYKRVREVFC